MVTIHMSTNPNTPYDNLDPTLILNAIESVGFVCNGHLTALNSYENRVYQVGIEDQQPLIAKFYRPHRWSDEAILEEHQFALELTHQEIPVVAPIQSETGQTLHHYEGHRFALFPRQGGRPLELDNLEHLEWMGRFLGRLHAVGKCNSFKHRITLDSQTYGYTPYEYLLKNNFIPEELKHNFCRVVDELLLAIKACYEQTGEITYIRLHGDCHPGNVLWNAQGPHIVDLDDCLMGPAIQDIWMLLSGSPKDVNLQLDCILEGYEEFCDFNYREKKLIEALRALRMIHYAGWLAKRWDDPAFPRNFPWFNTPRYWQEQLQHFSEQLGIVRDAIEREL
jgi:Ser/Thr protein kinase RdoA (MazF antagonist)